MISKKIEIRNNIDDIEQLFLSSHLREGRANLSARKNKDKLIINLEASDKKILNSFEKTILKKIEIYEKIKRL